MNSLELHIRTHLGSAGSILRASLNTLQENGIISDNCMEINDVYESDCPAAIAFLPAPPLKAHATGDQLGFFPEPVTMPK